MSRSCYLLTMFHYRLAYKIVGLVVYVDQNPVPMYRTRFAYIIFTCPKILSYSSASSGWRMTYSSCGHFYDPLISCFFDAQLTAPPSRI